MIYWTLLFFEFGLLTASGFLPTPLHKATLFGHPGFVTMPFEQMHKTPQLFLLRHEVNHLEMDVSRDLLDTAVGVNGFFG